MESRAHPSDNYWTGFKIGLLAPLAGVEGVSRLLFQRKLRAPIVRNLIGGKGTEVFKLGGKTTLGLAAGFLIELIPSLGLSGPPAVIGAMALGNEERARRNE